MYLAPQINRSAIQLYIVLKLYVNIVTGQRIEDRVLLMDNYHYYVVFNNSNNNKKKNTNK